ncbi:MAG TPA: hypothetical protein VGD80_18170 [Kofleriaceae bacterium]
MTILRGLAMFSMVTAAGCGLLGGDDHQVAISGSVMMSAARSTAAAAPGGRTITHVMAVNPETASPQRTIGKVASDGSFELSVDTGKPYVLVFIDSTAVGADMVVAMFRARTLDTLSPQLAGHLDLGDMEVDPNAQTASLGIPYDDLLAGLGLSSAAAEYLGAVDDLSLRYANPDIDGDGVIDMEQDHHYALDFHVRANMRIGSSTGRNVTVDDVTDHFLADTGAAVATPVFNLTSAYALYPASLDSTQYVVQGAPSSALQHGAAFSVRHADGSPPSAMTSFSSLGFGDTAGWGPDYSYESSPGLELPGSGGSPATLAYTLGAIGKTLTFTNVVTRTRASLTDAGTLAIFVRLVTADARYSSIDYRWMKRASASSWVPATAEEIALTISGDGGHVSFHRAPSWHNEFGATIPAQPAGSIAWSWETSGPDDICGLAVSYDDKLGLRHFVGGADPNAGVSCTP